MSWPCSVRVRRNAYRVRKCEAWNTNVKLEHTHGRSGFGNLFRTSRVRVFESKQGGLRTGVAYCPGSALKSRVLHGAFYAASLMVRCEHATDIRGRSRISACRVCRPRQTEYIDVSDLPLRKYLLECIIFFHERLIYYVTRITGKGLVWNLDGRSKKRRPKPIGGAKQ